jgi:hypothetical protein
MIANGGCPESHSDVRIEVEIGVEMDLFVNDVYAVSGLSKT